MADISPADQFLLQEYEAAVKLTYHIDELRNSITGFFLTFAGVAAAGLALLLKGEAMGGTNSNAIFKSPSTAVALSLLLVVVVEIIMVCILGKLRRAQIEHFGIANNVRTYFLRHDCERWNVVQLSVETLPKPNRKSGTYFWTALIIMVGSCLLSFCSYLFLVNILMPAAVLSIACIVFLASLLLQDRLYFLCAQTAEPKKYLPGKAPIPEHLKEWIKPLDA